MKKQTKHSKKRIRGFSLIELMIAMAVVLVLVGALVISGQRALRASNETSAQQNVSSLASDAQAFSHAWSGYPPLASNMEGSELQATTAATFAKDEEIPTGQGALLDAGTYVNGGYKIAYHAGPDTFTDSAGNIVSAEFEFTAIPQTTGSGTKSSCSDQSGVWSGDATTGAVAASGAGCKADGYPNQ